MGVRIENLNFYYGKRKVLDEINLSVKDGELVSILGENGVGKSTLFKCILGSNKKYEGDILIHGKNIREFSHVELAKKVAYIPQSHYSAFNYKVIDMVLMGTASQLSFYKSPSKEQVEFSENVLKMLGILHLKERNYSQISGGEQQLTLMARALTQQAKILIMDEPTSNMDYGNQLRVMNQIKELTQKGYTIIQSTHNPDQAYMFSDKIIALNKGKKIAEGKPNEVIIPEVIKKLYNVEVIVHDLYNDKLRVCVPMDHVFKLI